MARIFRLLSIPILLFLFSSHLPVKAQHACGTVVTPAVEKHWRTTESLRNNYRPGLRSGPDMIAVTVHIIRMSDGTGGLSVSELKSIMDDLNEYYINANMQFYQCGAINYIDSDTYYDFNSSDENTMGSANDVANTANIYFANTVTTGSGAACGYAYYPGGSPERILMDNSCALNGSTMLHEVGHFFYLFHTHETAFGAELVDGSNCTVGGDKVCDTDADPTLSSSVVDTECNYTGGGTDGNGDPYTPPTTNIMSYSRKSCRDVLTAGQYSRAETANGVYRTNMHSSCSSTDAGVYAIQDAACVTMNPVVTIKNYGNTTLTSVDLKYQVDGGSVSTYNWTGSLSALSTEEITLSLGHTSSKTIKAWTTAPNSISDVVNYNDTVEVITNVLSTTVSSFPAGDTYESLPWTFTLNPSNDFDWATGSGSTPSGGTGPSSAQQGSSYIFLEASTPNYPFKSSSLDACVDLSGYSSTSLSFYYHMYGGSMGTLQILVSDDNGTSFTSVWSLSGDQGNSWTQATVDLSAYDGQSILLRINGTTGSGWDSDMAIDDLSITTSVAPSTTAWVGTTTDWNTGTNWNPGGVPTSTDDITIDGNIGNQPIISGNSSVEVQDVVFSNGGNITINSGSSLTINGDVSGTSSILGSGTVTFSSGSHSISAATSVNGVLSVPTGVTLNTNGNLTLEDGASLMHGTGTTGGGGTISGNVTVKREGAASIEVFNYFGSPISNANTTTLGGTVYRYDETNNDADYRNDWELATGTMTVGLGYTTSGAGSVSFTGTVNDGNISIPVTVTSSGTSNEDGWNLISNPYPSALDAVAFINGNSGLITGENVYLWDDPGTGAGTFTSGDYATYNKNLGGVSGGGGNTPTDFIPSCQGFFVQTTSPGSINFTNAMRSSQNTSLLKRSPVDAQRLKISVTNPNNSYNEAMIAFKEDATDGLDAAYDALKNSGNSNLSLYTEIDGAPYVIQTFGTVEQSTKVVPLVLEGSIPGVYEFSVTMFDNFDETALVMLEDKTTGLWQDLRQVPYYTIQVDSGKWDNRFFIHFLPPLVVDLQAATCTGNDGLISVTEYGDENWLYTLKDKQGINEIAQGSISNGNVDIDELRQGNYQLELTHGSYTITQPLTILGKDLVTADFAASVTTIEVGEEMQLTNGSVDADWYEWHFGDGTTSNAESPTHTYLDEGTYTVSLYASNSQCTDVWTQDITVFKLSTGIEEVAQWQPLVYSSGSHLVVHTNTMTNTDLYLYNLLGEMVYSQSALASVSDHQVASLSSGVYIAQLVSGDQQYTQKVQLAR